MCSHRKKKAYLFIYFSFETYMFWKYYPDIYSSLRKARASYVLYFLNYEKNLKNNQQLDLSKLEATHLEATYPHAPLMK